MTMEHDMTEESAIYDVGESIPVTLDAFKNRPCSLPKSNRNYRPPKPQEVKALISLCGWSQRITAMITGVNYTDKGSTTVRRWQYPKSHYRAIDYAAWRLMLITAGVVDQDDALDDIGHYQKRKTIKQKTARSQYEKS